VKQSFATIIFGGTGQVGGAAVAELVATSECREVVMVTRKPIAPRIASSSSAGSRIKAKASCGFFGSARESVNVLCGFPRRTGQTSKISHSERTGRLRVRFGAHLARFRKPRNMHTFTDSCAEPILH
jgi:hypothetical protein